MLGLLITIVGLVVCWGRGMIGWGVVDSMVGNWGMVDSMVSNWGVVNSMVNRGSMMDRVSTECCEWSGWPTSHKGDKSNQSKDLKREFLIFKMNSQLIIKYKNLNGY
jgi:hypothetical protein